MASTAMKVTISHTLLATSISASFDFFVDDEGEAREKGREASDAFSAFLEGYAEASNARDGD